MAPILSSCRGVLLWHRSHNLNVVLRRYRTLTLRQVRYQLVGIAEEFLQTSWEKALDKLRRFTSHWPEAVRDVAWTIDECACLGLYRGVPDGAQELPLED